MLRELNYGVHICHLPIQMDGNNGCNRASTAHAYEFAIREFAALCEIATQRFWIHVVCALINVDKLWEGPRLRDGLGRGNEGVWNRYYYVAGFHSSSY